MSPFKAITLIAARCRAALDTLSVRDVLILTQVFFFLNRGDKSADIKDVARGARTGPVLGIKRGYNLLLEVPRSDASVQ